MAFDGRYEDADGPSEARAEQGPRAGKDGGNVGVSAEPRGHDEYYEALRAADSGESPGDDGDGPEAQGSHHTDARGDGSEKKYAGDAETDAGQSSERADAHPVSAWDEVAADERPPVDATRVSQERAEHILDGDDNGGGHRHGTGKPGKTEFPASWSDAKIINLLQDVARRPDDTPIRQDNGRWFTTGTREEVEIVAVVERDAQVWTGWPLPGGPGVVQNPRRPDGRA
jgi:hypothetical protein